jgi:hypothetical protein
MARAVEIEFASQVEIELALADQLPGQLAAGKAAFERRTFGIDSTGDRRERGGKIIRLLGRQAFLRLLW